MQSYGELKHLLKTFNELIFGCGFYYYWEQEAKRAMKVNKSQNTNGNLLVIYVTFDPWFAHQFEIYFKHCTEHNLPHEYYIPDHWTKPAFEIESIEFASVKENEDENLVKEFTLKLNYRTSSEPEYYWIKAKRFHYNQIKR